MARGGPTVQLRRANPADNGAVAQIWHDGWRDGHLGHVPQALHDVRTRESFDIRAAQRVDDTVVAVIADATSPEDANETEETIAGFVMIVDDEVEQVYVAQEHRGTTVAAELLSEAERMVADNGHDRAWLAVVAGNARARRFYAKHGWIDDGAFDYHAAADDGPIPVPAHRYVKFVGRT